MVTIKEEKVKVYACDYCKFEHKTLTKAQWCEEDCKQRRCDHVFDFFEMDTGLSTIELWSQCSKCGIEGDMLIEIDCNDPRLIEAVKKIWEEEKEKADD